MILIEFKLHKGRIPYFVSEYLSYEVNNRHYGIASKDESNYLPKTVIILTREQFIDGLKQAGMSKPSSNLLGERELMSEEEKVLFIENWIDSHLSG